MASDRIGLHFEDAPVAPGECSFESAGWSCASTGYLWFSERRDRQQYDYPCPRCNAELFLAKARKRAGGGAPVPRCPCCDPRTAAEAAYQSALNEARTQRYRCG